jgi:hypothetical protein
MRGMIKELYKAGYKDVAIKIFLANLAKELNK